MAQLAAWLLLGLLTSSQALSGGFGAPKAAKRKKKKRRAPAAAPAPPPPPPPRFEVEITQAREPDDASGMKKVSLFDFTGGAIAARAPKKEDEEKPPPTPKPSTSTGRSALDDFFD